MSPKPAPSIFTASFGARNSPESASSNSSCPLPRDPRDAQDLAALHREADLLQRRAKGWASARTVSSPRAPPRPWASRCARAGSASHPPSSRPARAPISPRGAGGHHLAPPQDRGRIAERADLFQLVADIEDRRALEESWRSVWNRISTSCGVRTLVGSSMMSSLGSCSRQRMISTRCRSPALRSPTSRSGSSGRPYSSLTCRMRCASSPISADAPSPRHVLGHVQRLEQAEMLKQPSPRPARAPRWAWAAHRARAAQRHLPAVGLDQPVDHLHQRRLARAVLAQQGVNLAPADRKRHSLLATTPG